MGTIAKQSLLGGAVGLVLALVGWLIWHLAAPGWEGTLTGALTFGFFSGGAATLLISLLASHRLAQAPDMKEAGSSASKHKKKRRRNSGACRARIKPTFHWQALSKSLLRLLHAKKTQVVGQSIFELLHPEDVPAVDDAFTKARTSKEPQHVQCRFQRTDAKQNVSVPTDSSDTAFLPVAASEACIHVRLDVWARLDRAGKVRWFECRFVDLTRHVLKKEGELQTARKEIERVKKRLHMVGQDLARLKLSYRELYQQAPVMYFSMDSEGRLVTFNDTLVQTLGYERRELQNQQYTLLLAPATLRSYVTISEAMPSQEGELETQWRKKDGSVIDVWLHSIPVYDTSGRFVRYRSAALDLTEKARLSRELRVRGDELERTNQRLRTINGELETFTHVVSHDLKEPLRTLQAYSHILAEEHSAQLGPDGFQYINHLIRASRRLGTLIDELLVLSHAGRITHAPKAFNLIEIVATVRQDLVDLIQRKEATLSTEGSLPDVIGDPARITQLLTNLVTNGLKYNQNPRPTIVIGAMPAEPGRITVWVRDNGIGIDAAFHTQIFGIFRRLHQANEYEGTGAGLAICKKIVEGHGGRIWVESKPGEGATFYFTLPRSPLGRIAPLQNGAPRKAEEIKAPVKRRTAIHLDRQSSPPRIVLVEDQSDVAMIIQMLGKRDGLAITWFPTAEAAWEYLRKERADLLLFDVNLPGISGDELCRRIRKLAHHKDTPVAMFTPHFDPQKVEELRTAGADFFLTKDLLCQPAQWQRRLQELLAQLRQNASH